MEGAEFFLRNADVVSLRLACLVWIIENPHAHLGRDLCGAAFGEKFFGLDLSIATPDERDLVFRETFTAKVFTLTKLHHKLLQSLDETNGNDWRVAVLMGMNCVGDPCVHGGKLCRSGHDHEGNHDLTLWIY